VTGRCAARGRFAVAPSIRALVERREVAGTDALGRLDLEHVGSEVGELAGRLLADLGCEIEHAEAG
jgi:hypothetical protein